MKVENIFPAGSLPLNYSLLTTTGFEALAFEIDSVTVKKAVLSSHKSLAAGCSGLRAEHVKCVLMDHNQGKAAEMTEVLTKIVNLCIAGYLPQELQEHFCGGRLIPLNKKDAGIRPIVVGEFLRELTSKLALKQVEHQLHALQPAQVGVGGKGPVIQAAILCVKYWLGEMAADELLLKVDIANAYNRISREACLAGVKKYCPDIGRWAHWCLNGTSRIYYDKYVIPCATGVQQGDPLAPALFSIGLHADIERLFAIHTLRQIWFLDEWLLRGKPQLVANALAKLRSWQRSTCKHAQKCELYLAPTSNAPEGFGNIPVVRDIDAWSYLGTLLCEQTAKAMSAAYARVKQATAKIAAFAKTHPKQPFHSLATPTNQRGSG